MQVKEIMTRHIEMVNATESVLDAAKKMKSLDVGVLPVKEGNKIIGMITDRDIVIRALAEDKSGGTTLVKDIMSSEIQRCSSEDSVESAAAVMKEKQLRRLLVLDPDNTPVGIISLGDIAAKSHEEQLAGETLEEISKPAGSAR